MRIFGLDIQRASKRGIVTEDGQSWPVNLSTFGASGGTLTFLDAIYRTIADEFSKLDFYPASEQDGNFEPLKNLKLYQLMTLRPNALMSASEWLWIVAYQTVKYQHSLTKVVKDGGGTVIGLEPIDITDWEFGKGFSTVNNKLYITVRAKSTSRTEIWPYDSLIHLRFNPNNIFTGEKACALDGSGGIVKLFDKSLSRMLEEYASGSGQLRGIVKVGSSSMNSLNQAAMSQEAKISKAKEIVARIRAAGTGGIATLDAGEEWQDLTYRSLEGEQIKSVLGYITSLKGVSEKVIAGTATEQEMEVFFAKSVMPLVERFREEATHKLFSESSKASGSYIALTRNMFEYVSAKTAMDSLYKGHMDLTVNEVRKWVYGLAPIEGGDKLLNNKNFELQSQGNGGESND